MSRSDLSRLMMCNSINSTLYGHKQQYVILFLLFTTSPPFPLHKSELWTCRDREHKIAKVESAMVLQCYPNWTNFFKSFTSNDHKFSIEITSSLGLINWFRSYSLTEHLGPHAKHVSSLYVVVHNNSDPHSHLWNMMFSRILM